MFRGKSSEVTMEDTLVEGTRRETMQALKSVSTLIHYLNHSQRSETALRLDAARRSLSECLAVLSGVYGSRKGGV